MVSYSFFSKNLFQNLKYLHKYSNDCINSSITANQLPFLSQHDFHLHVPLLLCPFSMLSKIHSSYQCASVSVWLDEAVD